MTTAVGKGARTRAEVLGCAIRRFATDGLRAASVSAIARDAQVTPGTVYSYFPSKRALFDEAVDTDAAGLIADALPDVLQGRFDRDWGGLFARLLTSLPDHPLARRVLAGQEGTTAERLIDLSAVAQVRAGLAQALRAGQVDGQVRPDIDPDTVASGIESVVMALLIAILQTGGRPDPDRLAGILALLEAAIDPPATPRGGGEEGTNGRA